MVLRQEGPQMGQLPASRGGPVWDLRWSHRARDKRLGHRTPLTAHLPTLMAGAGGTERALYSRGQPPSLLLKRGLDPGWGAGGRQLLLPQSRTVIVAAERAQMPPLCMRMFPPGRDKSSAELRAKSHWPVKGARVPQLPWLPTSTSSPLLLQSPRILATASPAPSQERKPICSLAWVQSSPMPGHSEG